MREHFIFLRLGLIALALLAANAAQAEHNALTPAEQAAGWKLLFDGKKVTGLRGLQKADFLKAGWKIQGGALLLPKEVKDSGNVTGGDLITTEAFVDFEFSFDWKLAVSGDAGVLYLARAGPGQKPSGCEFQLIDDLRHPDGMKGGPLHRTGGLYGILPPGENKELADGGWNHGRLLVRGNHVEHWINDAKVLEYVLGGAALQNGMLASKKRFGPGFGTKFKSPILLLDQGEEVAFRNLKVRLITQTAPAGPAGAVPRSPGSSTPAAKPAQPAGTLPPLPPPVLFPQ